MTSGAIWEGSVSIPTRRTGAALQGDGTIGKLQVGSVLVCSEVLGQQASSGSWLSWAGAGPSTFLLGPIASETGVVTGFSLLAPETSANISTAIYMGANRGRGQIYPDGSSSNLVRVLTQTAGITSAVIAEAKRYGSVV